MAKRRMREWMRDRLIMHVNKTVDPAPERKAMDAAYRKLAPMIARLVAHKFKPADMDVLTKYGVSTADTCIKLTLPDARVVQFQLRATDAVRVPVGRCSGRMFLADHAIMAAYDHYSETLAAHKDETRRRVEGYDALIRNASSVEDIVAVWPEAAALLPATAIMAPLTREQLALIELDRSQRRAA